MDYYLDSNHVYDRLLLEYDLHGRLIICVDFDDTIFDFHKKGYTYEYVIQLLKRWQEYADIIVWTGNGEEQYDLINSYCKEQGIQIYGINCDSSVKVTGRKIYANVYLDDRAGLAETYEILLRLINEIDNRKEL